MHDANAIRRDMDCFREAMAARGVSRVDLDRLVSLDHDRRTAEAEAQSLRERRNAVAGEVARGRKLGHDTAALVEEGRDVGGRLTAAESRAAEAHHAFLDVALGMPNAALPDVPVGGGEADNVVEETFGKPDVRPWSRPHWEIPAAMGLDIPAGVALAGARFAVLRGALARLERALGQFMMDLHVGQHGRLEVSVPHMVSGEVLRGTGHLPKFADDLFPAGDGHWLIPTAEVPLTGLIRAASLPEGELPMRLVALTPCYRAEAGSAGRDTRGLLRQHQFHKVEMVTVCAPEHADEEHRRMLGEAEAVLRALALPYRRVLLCTGDMGFSAARTWDLEVWMPGQGAWREISSVSTCGDFQARRLGARIAGRGKALPHTLNGSGIAVGRALVAVLENFIREDGGIDVPAALRPYMGGNGRITADGALAVE